MTGRELHFVRVVGLGDYEGGIDVWLRCSCGWESDSSRDGMDVDVAAMVAASHRKRAS